MKVIERHPIPKNRYGKIILSNQTLEPHELSTVLCLASFGFNLEILRPTNIPKSNNPDLFMLGTTWEMKSPLKINEKTIQKRFHKACRQSGGRAIFDLRHIQANQAILDLLLKLFQSSRLMRRIFIIISNNCLLDVRK